MEGAGEIKTIGGHFRGRLVGVAVRETYIGIVDDEFVRESRIEYVRQIGRYRLRVVGARIGDG